MRVRLHTQQTTNFSTHSKSSLTNGVDQSQDFIRALQWQREELWVKRGQALDQSFGLGDITLLTQNLAGFKILDLKEKHMTCRKTNCSWPVQKKQTDEDWSVPGCNLLSVWGHPCGVIFKKKKCLQRHYREIEDVLVSASADCLKYENGLVYPD